MTSTPSTTTEIDPKELKIESCLKSLSILNNLNEETMKLRLQLAEQQIKILSLYDAPSLEMLQHLLQMTERSQMNDLTENNLFNMQVDNINL